MSSHPFNVGDIVALKSHPFSSELTKIIISGDHVTLPPLMVIGEILNDNKNLYDEFTANPISDRTQGNCKCIWYSNKSAQFEEAWISTKFLKVIVQQPKNDDIHELKINALVYFKTMKLELQKQKSSFSIDGNVGNKDNPKLNITPLLNYVSPIMQVIEIKNNESKEVKFDSKTGIQRRYISVRLVKCKWYNASTDKLSEKILPLEVLAISKVTDVEYLKSIELTIKSGGFYSVKFSSNRYATLLKPMNIIYKNGEYYLRGYDMVTNDVREIFIDNEDLFTEEPRPVLKKLPTFDDLAKPEISKAAKEELLNAIVDAREKSYFLKIVYRNRNEKVTTRTINSYQIENDADGNPTFVKGYCNSRDEERTFRIERIQNMEVLNIKYLP